MRRTIATTAVTLAVTGLLALPASAAPTDDSGDRYTQTFGVVEGSLSFTKGNRHQLVVKAATDPRTGDTEATGYLRSYYCPSGATITHRWASSACTWRSTHAVTAAQDGFSRVSSTQLSARQGGEITLRSSAGSSYRLPVDLVLRQSSNPGGEWYRLATVSGNVSATPYRPTPTSDEQAGYGVVG